MKWMLIGIDEGISSYLGIYVYYIGDKSKEP